MDPSIEAALATLTRYSATRDVGNDDDLVAARAYLGLETAD